MTNANASTGDSNTPLASPSTRMILFLHCISMFCAAYHYCSIIIPLYVCVKNEEAIMIRSDAYFFSGTQDDFLVLCYDDNDNNKPVFSTWAVGALFRGARCIHIYRV